MNIFISYIYIFLKILNHHEDNFYFLKSQNDNVSLPFYVELFLPLSSTRLCSDWTKIVTRRACYKKQELISIREHLGSPTIFWCFYVLFVSFWVLCPTLPVYIDYSFLVAPLVSSNVYVVIKWFCYSTLYLKMPLEVVS